MPRPALGKVAVGDELLVIEASYNNSRIQKLPITAVVEKAGRVWVDLVERDQVKSHRRTWRLRLDTQDTGSKYSHTDRFVTAEQHAWEQRTKAARKVLFEAGISFNTMQSWRWDRDEDRLLALAAFVADYDAEHPTTPPV